MLSKGFLLKQINYLFTLEIFSKEKKVKYKQKYTNIWDIFEVANQKNMQIFLEQPQHVWNKYNLRNI